MEKIILHITFEYPDLLTPKTTTAIKNLIETNTKHKNIIFSLHRTMKFWNCRYSHKNNLFVMNVFGFPFGIFHTFFLYIAALQIIKVISKKRLSFDVIHAHKMTFEGILSRHILKKYPKKLIMSIRGDTDLKLLKFKPSIKKLCKSLINRADHIIIISPWVQNPIESRLSIPISQKMSLIPNFVQPVTPTHINNLKQKTFLTALNFFRYRNKNIKRLIQAFDILFDVHPDLHLDIAGDGKEKLIIQGYINKTKRRENFHFLGYIPNSKLCEMYGNYCGFVLPSYPETFGYVFIEALQGGLPVIHSKNAGIDGFFDEDGVSIKVNHRSPQEIADAIENMYKNFQQFRENVKKLSDKNRFEQFRSKFAKKEYEKIIKKLFDEGP